MAPKPRFDGRGRERKKFGTLVGADPWETKMGIEKTQKGPERNRIVVSMTWENNRVPGREQPARISH